MTQKQKGIFLIILSAFFFSLMNTFVKLAGSVPAIQKSFFRNFLSLFIALFILRKKQLSLKCKKEDFTLLMIRAIFGTAGILCNYYALSHINLADATMLNKLAPFFVIIFSYIFLKEHVNLKQMCFLCTAFLGSIFIIKPGFDFTKTLPSVLGLFGGIFAGAAYASIRALGLKNVNENYIVFFFSAFSCIFTLPYLLFFYYPMSNIQLLYLLLASIFSTIGQYCITVAYIFAPGKDISIYDYSIIIFASIWSFVFWGDIPDIFSILGYCIIFLSSFLMSFYNKNL